MLGFKERRMISWRLLLLSRRKRGRGGDLFRDNGNAAHKRFYLALGIQFMQQMTGEFKFHVFFTSRIPKICRYQYCNILCSHSISKQLRDEPGKISSAWLISSTSLYHCFILDGIFLIETRRYFADKM